MLLQIPCPGCGFLHAIWAALSGDWGAAFGWFPIWPVALGFLLFFRRSVWMGRIFVASLFGQWVIRLGLMAFSH